MEEFVKEMCEDFKISEAYSRYKAIVGDDTDAQNVLLYYNYMKHAFYCKKASELCINFLKTKDFNGLILGFKKLKLYNNMKMLKEKYNEINNGNK
jgi:hypothetical protein